MLLDAKGMSMERHDFASRARPKVSVHDSRDLKDALALASAPPVCLSLGKDAHSGRR